MLLFSLLLLIIITYHESLPPTPWSYDDVLCYISTNNFYSFDVQGFK